MTSLTPTVRERLAEEPGREHFYVSLLGLRTYESAKLHERVEEGLSYHALERLRETMGLPLSEFAELVGIPRRTLARRERTGTLEPEESDRLLRLARVMGHALRLFGGDVERTRSWLARPRVSLNGHSPLELAGTDVGAREVERLIGRLEYGIPG